MNLAALVNNRSLEGKGFAIQGPQVCNSLPTKLCTSDISEISLNTVRNKQKTNFYSMH